MGISKTFERKFLFSAGRYLSNFFAVSGVFTVLIGMVTFLNSSKMTSFQTLDEYTKKLNQELDLMENEFDDKMNELSYSYQTDPEAKKAYDKMEAQLARKYDALEKAEEEWPNYVSKIYAKKEQDRTLAPFVIGYGFVAIASAATSSAVFSIERSLSKD